MKFHCFYLVVSSSLAFVRTNKLPFIHEKRCNCDTEATLTAPASKKLITQHSLLDAGSDDGVHLSKVEIHSEHAGNAGLSLSEVSEIYGGLTMTDVQRHRVKLMYIANVSFSCLDDRSIEPTLATPGGDLGEFVLATASYYEEKDGAHGDQPSQEMIDSLLEKYLDTIPPSRPIILCTDASAIKQLEEELAAGALDLTAPSNQAKSAGLLEKLTLPENQGDSHFRLLLKQPEWFQLNRDLVPKVLRSFYTLLWEQEQDSSSRLHASAKLKLKVLSGEPNPQAFLEVTCSGRCKAKGMAPMLRPQEGSEPVLISTMEAASFRRKELAGFFAKVSRSTPRKISPDRLHKRIEKHGWLALETTGSRIASGLPFYSMTYT